MKPWAETGIGIVFFAGLIISAFAGISALMLLRPVKNPVEKIAGGKSLIWLRSFFTTVLIAAITGALSISFRDCGGDYDTLLQSREQTVMKGLEQVSSSFNYLALTLGIWTLLFISLFIFFKKRPAKPGS